MFGPSTETERVLEDSKVGLAVGLVPRGWVGKQTGNQASGYAKLPLFVERREDGSGTLQTGSRKADKRRIERSTASSNGRTRARKEKNWKYRPTWELEFGEKERKDRNKEDATSTTIGHLVPRLSLIRVAIAIGLEPRHSP